jgi:putative ABC transport system permease protein
MSAILPDLRFACRMLARNPGFSAVVIVTLGLGIGLNTAIFSIVNAVLLQPLPYPKPEQLVQVQKEWQPPWLSAPEVTADLELNNAEVLAWQKEKQVFSQTAACERAKLVLNINGDFDEVNCLRISEFFLPLLGAPPVLGRGFLPEEERPGGPRAVMLSHGFWQRHFGGDAKVLGRTLILDEQPYTVIGVLAARFRFGEPCDLCLPLLPSPREYHSVRLMGRLRPGVGQEQARAALDVIYQQVGNPKEKGRVVLTPLHDYMVGDSKLSLLVYLGAIGFVLLIACANVANLLLARATHRRKEMAIRAALGAGRWPIIRQLLTESLVLGLLGSVLGLVLAFWGKNLIQALMVQLPAVSVVRLDGWVLAFTLLTGLLTGLLFGLVPALVASRTRQADALKEASRGSRPGGVQHRHLSGLLVVSEVTLALVLLVGAGLLIKNFVRLRGTNLGFRLDHFLSLRLEPSKTRYPDARSRTAYFEQVIERLRRVPGVEAVGADSVLPLSGWRSAFGSNIGWHLDFAVINPDYFQTLGIPLKKGRWFTDADRTGTPQGAVVNESYVQSRSPNEDPLGKGVKARGAGPPIIGVVGDVRQFGPKSLTEPLAYFSYLQVTNESQMDNGMFLVVRTRGNPMKLAGVVRSQIQSVDKEQAPQDVMTLEQRLAGMLAPERLNMQLSGALGVVALALVVLGIYGVLSFSVAERTHEIGVRMALGAQPRDVVKLVMRDGLILTVAGAIFGFVAAYWLTSYIGTWLYDVSCLDTATFVLVPIFLVLVALLACYVPARRGTKVDPLVALREE